ncbi:MAG: hypothetical protein HY719_08505 [Planctomycetes bacterium]|nr:hypothetical protein [Planctomycetota bacterium]
MGTISRQVSVVRQRLLLERVCERLVVTVTFAIFLLCGWFVAAQASLVAWDGLAAGLLACGAALGVALVWGAVGLPSRERVSLLMDERLAGQERFSTALVLSDRVGDEVVRAVVRDAEQALREAAGRPVARFRAPLAARILPFACVGAGLLFLLMPEFDPFGHRAREAEQRRQRDRVEAAARALAVEAEEVRKDLAKPEARGKYDEVREALARIEEAREEFREAPPTPEEAMARLSELDRQVAEREKDAVEKMKTFQDAVSKASWEETTSNLMDALQDLDAERAQQELEKLKAALGEQIKSGKLSGADLKRLGAELQKMAAAMENSGDLSPLAKDLKDLGETMAEAGQTLAEQPRVDAEKFLKNDALSDTRRRLREMLEDEEFQKALEAAEMPETLEELREAQKEMDALCEQQELSAADLERMRRLTEKMQALEDRLEKALSPEMEQKLKELAEKMREKLGQCQKQLEELEKQMEQACQGMEQEYEQAQPELTKEQIDRLISMLDALSADDLQQLMEQLMESEMLGKLRAGLSRGMGKLSGEDLGEMLSLLESLRARGRGRPVVKNSARMGRGGRPGPRGRGGGEQPRDTFAPDSDMKDERATGKSNPGSYAGAGYERGLPQEGLLKVPRSSPAREAAQREEEAIDSTLVPPRYRKHLRQYFRSLKPEAVDEGAGGAAAPPPGAAGEEPKSTSTPTPASPGGSGSEPESAPAPPGGDEGEF